MSQPKSPNAAATSNAVPLATEAYTPDIPTNASEGTSNAVPPATEAYTPYVPTNASEGRVDWSTLHINESAAEDDRDVAMGDDAMYELLGLTDEDGIANHKMQTACLHLTMLPTLVCNHQSMSCKRILLLLKSSAADSLM